MSDEIDDRAEGEFFIGIQTEYQDPAPLIGPFPTFDAAVLRYWDRIIEAGYEPDESENAHVSYVLDDQVKIYRLVEPR